MQALILMSQPLLVDVDDGLLVLIVRGGLLELMRSLVFTYMNASGESRCSNETLTNIAYEMMVSSSSELEVVQGVRAKKDVVEG